MLAIAKWIFFTYNRPCFVFLKIRTRDLSFKSCLVCSCCYRRFCHNCLTVNVFSANSFLWVKKFNCFFVSLFTISFPPFFHLATSEILFIPFRFMIKGSNQKKSGAFRCQFYQHFMSNFYTSRFTSLLLASQSYSIGIKNGCNS